MPILSDGDRKSWSGKLVVLAVYFLLIVGAFTMAYPFMVTFTGSMSNAYDYERRSPYPSFLVSREDRLMRVLCTYFPPEHYSGMKQMHGFFPTLPDSWQSWLQISDDIEGSKIWAGEQLADLEDPQQAAYMATMAGDYHDFMQDWNMEEAVLAFDVRFLSPFLQSRYGTTDKLNAAWGMAIDEFSEVGSPPEWRNEAFYQPSYMPFRDERHDDLKALRNAYLENKYTPFLADDPLAAPSVRPMALAYTWQTFASPQLGITDPIALNALPFPVPASADPELISIWYDYLHDSFPMRHIIIVINDERQTAFRAFLRERFHRVDYFNSVMHTGDPNWQDVTDWDDVTLTSTIPNGTLGKAWIDYIKTQIPVAEWTVNDTLAEQAYQAFALQRHGSLNAINEAYGLDLKELEQLRIPLREALLTTFDRHEGSFTWDMLTRNYRTVFDYLVLRGRAVVNTIILVLLTCLLTLTVNPLAGYALSRFRLPQSEKILVFCLATMAFPASVAAIPGFLLLRDLGLLNTFAALVLPSAANGMGIFLLKGFFDSLPQELFEAATIDGAPEWQVFSQIALPLVKPILAVNLLGAFVAAYSGWSWAIIVAQDKAMWTIAVWTYQFSQIFSNQPFAVMAAYMINSLPVFLVFIFCQRIIMRGIILPQMK